MEHRLNRIEEKVDSLKNQFESQKEASNARAETLNRTASMIMQINEKMGQHTELLAKNTASLEYHILRTDLAEKNLELLRLEVKDTQKEIKDNTAFRTKAEWTFKILGMVGTAVGAIFAGIKAIESLINIL